jgi:hypothetical protein
MISVFRGAVDRDATPFLQVCKNVEKISGEQWLGMQPLFYRYARMLRRWKII